MGFANLEASLGLNISNFTANMRKAVQQASTLSANLNNSINTGLVAPAKQAKFAFKDVARVAQGIIVSRIFYDTLNNIKEATNAVWKFNEALELATVKYTALFKDAGTAKEFINVLKDFAAETPATFQDADAAAQRLAAFSIPAENLMYMMRGISAATAAIGDPTAMNRISLALGQMYTKGRLFQQELNQITNAGIPAMEILREKLNLTSKELKNIGAAGIDASTAINALVDGMIERYSGAMEAAAKTLPGLANQIADILKDIFSEATQGLYVSVRETFTKIYETLSSFRKIVQTKGLGGLFEAIVPKELHATLRQLIGSFMYLGGALQSLFTSLKPVIAILGGALLNILSVLIPILSTIISVAAALLRVIAQHKIVLSILTGALLGATVALIIFKVAALRALIIGALAKATEYLAKTMIFLGLTITKGGILRILMLVGALFGAIASSATGAGAAIRNFAGNLIKIAGLDTKKLLLPSQKERTAELEKFNKKLAGTSKSFDDLAKSSSKAAKGLMSFDEVYRIADTSGSGVEGPIDDMLAALEALEFPDIEMPDFDGIAGNFVDGFVEALRRRFNAVSWGALIGSLLLAGLKKGWKVGAIAGALIALFWPEISEAFGLSQIESIVGLATVAFAALLGRILTNTIKGTLVAAGIALIAATFGKLFWGAIAEHFEKDTSSAAYISSLIGGMLAAIIGGILFGPIGAIIAGAIGFFGSGFAAMFWDEIEAVTGLTAPEGVGIGLGVALGGAIGGVIGGPGGAIIGAAIAGLVGWYAMSIVGEFENSAEIKSIGGKLKKLISTGIATGEWDFAAIAGSLKKLAKEFGKGLEEYFSDPDNIPYEFIGNIVGGLLAAAIGTAFGGPALALLVTPIGIWVGGIFGKIVEAFKTGDWSNVLATEIGPIIGGSIGAAIGGIVGGPIGAGIGTAIGAFVGWFFGDLIDKMKNGDSEAEMRLGSTLGSVIGGGIGFFLGGPLGLLIGTLVGGLIGALVGGWDEVVNYFKVEAWTKFQTALAEVWGKVKEFFDTEGKTWWEIGRDILLGIGAGLLAGLATVVGTLWTFIVQPIIDGIKTLFGISSPASTMFIVGEEIINGIFSGILTIMSTVTTWLWTNVYSPIINYLLGIFGIDATGIKEIGSNIISGIFKGITDMLDGAKSFFSGVKDKFVNFFSSAFDSHSPAETMTPLGANIMGGIAKGITDSEQAILPVFQTLLGTIQGAAATWFGTMQTDTVVFFADINTSMTTFFVELKTSLNTSLAEVSTLLKNWGAGQRSAIIAWLQDIYASVKSYVAMCLAELAKLDGVSSGTKSSSTTKSSTKVSGHATGGVFTREHIAAFSEGNKAEMAVPLEDNQAMMPFVDAIARGIIESLAPVLSGTKGETVTPVYVGNLIADDRGLKELERRLFEIRQEEETRR